MASHKFRALFPWGTVGLVDFLRESGIAELYLKHLDFLKYLQHLKLPKHHADQGSYFCSWAFWKVLVYFPLRSCAGQSRSVQPAPSPRPGAPSPHPGAPLPCPGAPQSWNASPNGSLRIRTCCPAFVWSAQWSLHSVGLSCHLSPEPGRSKYVNSKQLHELLDI